MKLWFKAKRYGWGWTPCSWEGWVITAFSALAIGYFVSKAAANGVTIESVFPTLIIVGQLILICYLTGEKPGWRWGGRSSEE